MGTPSFVARWICGRIAARDWAKVSPSRGRDRRGWDAPDGCGDRAYRTSAHAVRGAGQHAGCRHRQVCRQTQKAIGETEAACCSRQAAVRRCLHAGSACGPRHRLLCPRLPFRRQAARHRRTGLAGHASVAQPQLGPSATGEARGTAGDRRQSTGRLARPPRWRHVATARRSHADGPCQPSGRPRRRHLAHSHARPQVERERTRGAVRHLHARLRWRQRRCLDLDSGACTAHPPRRSLPGSRARARAPGNQEGAVRGEGRRPQRAA